ncbi:MAG TPA: glycoside hydrolase family 2 TIM barrel-domain containing protein [Thermoanaerobaculia bacterium]|nr:glycoside hydrolase family 2 TIM barrel-domain containing protein [Thermoanaerobaculia bacterium]
MHSPKSRPQAPAQPRHGYPRPQLERAGWISLDGLWDFALDPEARWQTPRQVEWGSTILVPFSPETPASGIGNTGFYRRCWYRRTFEAPPLQPGERLLLHFGAVDWSATVWVNGCIATSHKGGYTPFTVDLTDLLDESPEQMVVVRADDDPADLAKPRGKQDWQLEPHSIWYPRTTGIWQTVWLERVPPTWIDSLRWTPSLDRWELDFEAWIAGEPRERLRLGVKLYVVDPKGIKKDELLAADTYTVVAGEVHRRIALSDPGIDDFRNELLWSPATPTLIDAQIQLWGERGELLDDVKSYTALRTIAIQGDRVVLNGRPFFLRMVLDQGYWPESGLTAPDDDALRRDVELAKAMGFNGVRKHQKIEDPRYLYWADRLGLLVWEEMPSAYRFTKRSINRLTREWMDAIRRDYSHPSIIAWVPFNESWGVPNLPDSQAERNWVRALYHLTKTLDPTRPVIGNDGWESIATDAIGIHDYDADPERIARRYHAEDVLPQLLKRERPGGRLLVLEEQNHRDLPVILTEFGGIAASADSSKTWGYSRAAGGEDLARRYAALLRVLNQISLFSGFCYTQFTDTYQEANGLLYANRTPKFPLELMERATRGLVEEEEPKKEKKKKTPATVTRTGLGTRHDPDAPDE